MRHRRCMTLYKTSAFQFTHPGRGATTTQEVRPTPLRVSIHAPREGCDRRTLLNAGLPPSFNSRTPGGVRLSDAGGGEASDGVSIHAPREGCDTCRAFQPFCLSSFNSRTPGGVRQSFSAIFVPLVSFNSRTPGGVRLKLTEATRVSASFNSRTPGGVRRESRVPDTMR